MSASSVIRIGTRGSPLALRQTEMVCALLAAVRPDLAVQTVVIKTLGDWVPEQGEAPLARQGGTKGLFAKEIEAQLLAGAVDAAVHSMKDMETTVPEGLMLAAMLPRADVRDAMVLRVPDASVRSLADLPAGSRIATCSIRRQGMLLAARPDLVIVPMRGNVGTRLEKLRADDSLTGIVLAAAGLNRLKLDNNIAFFLDAPAVLPCAAQGAIGIEIKRQSEWLLPIFSQINCPRTFLCVSVERAALLGLGGSCHTPVGVLCDFDERGDMLLQLRLVSSDGRGQWEESGVHPVPAGGPFSAEFHQHAEAFGHALGQRLRSRSPQDLIAP